MDAQKYIALFVDEARELTAKMAEALGRLRSEGSDESAVQEFFRNVHTLKGMASAMGFDEMVSLTHRLEDLFQKAMDEHQPPSETMLSAAYEAVDFIANSLDEVSQTGQPQTGAAALCFGSRSGGRAGSVGRRTGSFPSGGLRSGRRRFGIDRRRRLALPHYV
jgi:two-component system chemotaxis sensor kinase CheA